MAICTFCPDLHYLQPNPLPQWDTYRYSIPPQYGVAKARGVPIRQTRASQTAAFFQPGTPPFPHPVYFFFFKFGPRGRVWWISGHRPALGARQ